ncbi:MAG: DJ-1/PfpI family protein [Hyphomicrobiales bacterium]|nr:DJ-1/PfpI family protein [Hyphomicrobiales bacterium]
MRYLVWTLLALVALCFAGFAAWIVSLPPAAVEAEAPPIPQAETASMLAALQPPKRRRPLIAVVGVNDATETTDYVVPTGILRRADIADVVLLAAAPGPVKLFPALTVVPDATIAEFDARNPEGADYVIVPAMSRDDDPAILGWLRDQASKRAIVIGVCAGAKIVAAAGLLDGKRATTHWYYLKDLRARSPSIAYVRDRRMVVDHGVATTTGISASIPMVLSLIEAVAGREKAESVARDIGMPAWDARHASAAFQLTRPFATTILSNALAFWRKEQVRVEIAPGMDEASLALVADAWSRTYRSKAAAFSAATSPVETRNGVRVIPDAAAADARKSHTVSTFPNLETADALDHTLAAIAARYGDPTARVVAMQLEYPRAHVSAAAFAR